MNRRVFIDEHVYLGVKRNGFDEWENWGERKWELAIFVTGKFFHSSAIIFNDKKLQRVREMNEEWGVWNDAVWGWNGLD